MDLINRILKRNSPNSSNSTTPEPPIEVPTGIDVTRTPEHEIKVKFAREFIEITDDQIKKTDKQLNDNNSLSSASSFQSLTSTLSTKSSSGICIDSPSSISFDTSYANSDIPGLDDLLSACAGIRLEDSYADASFASANDQSNLDITQNIAEYKTHDNLNKTQEICKLNLTQDIATSSVDIFSTDYKNSRESLSHTLTDVDTDALKADKTIDSIQSLPVTSDSCLSSDSEHTFSSSIIDLNKTKDTVKEEIISQAQNNIEFDNCKFVVNENIHIPSDANNLSFVKTDESLQVTDTELIVDDNNVVEKSEVAVNQVIKAAESLSIEKIIDNPEDNIITDKVEKSVVEKTNVIYTLNQTVELTESLAIEKELDHKDNIATSEIKEADEQLNSATDLNQTIELSQPLVIEKNIDNQDNIESSHVEQTDEQSNVVFSLNGTFEISEQQLAIEKDFDHQENIISSEKPHEKSNVVVDNLNNTVQVSQPLLNENNIDDNIIVESDEKTIVVENISAKFDESKTLSFDKLKSEIFEALAAEKISDDVVSITNEVTSPLLIDNNQDFSQHQEQQQQKNTTLTLDDTDDDTLNCANKNTTVVKENTFDETINVNVDKDKNSSLNCANNVLLHDDNNTGFINSDYDFDKLKLEAQRVANDLYNTSIDCTDDKEEEFVLASTDLFIDPMSVDLSSLNSNKTKNITDNTAIDRLRAESLYVKFDPLVSSITMLPQGNISTSQKNDTTINGDNNDTCISELNSSPKRNPAIAALDRLLIYSPLPPSSIDKKNKEQEKILTREKTPEPITIIDTTMAKELELVRTNVLQLEEQIEQQKIKYHTDIKTINDDKEKLELQNITLRDTINQLKKELQQEIKNKNQVTIIVDEFRKTIERLNIEKEKDKNNYDNIKTNLYDELQDAKNHLTATEAAFNDVHAKYEKLKIVVTESRNNEKVLKESIEENIETIKLLENRYEQIKSHAAARLEKANHELDTIRKQHESDNVRVRAMLRKEELKSNSLAELVEQKTKENKELTQILDEVISRVGQKSDD
ncbi:interaptin isoform X2 [Aphidius gifuensis]|uniref:interaptin isoform X2 n=1 Tax=Aphidius gifuensis TaxID=684658 RepID=UPI001CDD1F45|nr:interaptin isoform X2 [Aphidius gifuensis]